MTDLQRRDTDTRLKVRKYIKTVDQKHIVQERVREQKTDREREQKTDREREKERERER